jgi:hypothetical protein
MSSRSRKRVVLASALACLVLPAGVARASAFSDIAAAYVSHGGSIPACLFSAGELNAALGSVPTDSQQYSADVIAAIQQALAEQAAGACGKHSTGVTVAPVTPTTPGAPPVPQSSVPVINPPPAPPAAARAAFPSVKVPLRALGASSDAGVPAPVVLLGALGGLCLLFGALVGLMRLRGWDPRWLAALRHSWSEAGFRVGAGWAEFSDWLRFSR